METKFKERPHVFEGDPGNPCLYVTTTTYSQGKTTKTYCGLADADPTHTQDPLAVSRNDFACICGEDGKERVKRVRQWVHDQLGQGSEELLPWNEERFSLVDAIVRSLNWDYRASITGIPTDQWSAVVTEGPDGFKTYIQCDDVLDGLCFTLRAYYDQFGEKYVDNNDNVVT